MDFTELDNIDTEYLKYLKIYKDYTHACSYEQFLLREQMREDAVQFRH